MVNGLHATNSEHLEDRYARNSDDSLILSDDEIEISNDGPASSQREVAAFKYSKQTKHVKDAEDFAIVRITENDFYYTALSNAHKLRQLGLRPALRLDGCAYEVQSEVRERFEQFLERPEFKINQNGYPIIPVIKILREMAEQGYDLWIVGGAVRDLLRPEVDVADVNDLDLAGTVPLGVMLKRLSVYKDRYGVTPVVSSGGILWLHRTPDRKRGQEIFQYAAIKSCVAIEQRAKKKEHWYSSDLKEDVRWRDLTFNSLFYDPFTCILLDPTGKGCEDLSYMRMTPIEPLDWPFQVTTSVLRILKFVDKYHDKRVELAPAYQMLLRIITDCYRELLSLKRKSDVFHLLLKFYGTESRLNGDLSLNELSRTASLVGIADMDEWNNVIDVLKGALSLIK